MQPLGRRRLFVVLEGDRRRGDRRNGRVCLRYPERRSGFDRRRPEKAGRIRSFVEQALEVMRRDGARLGMVLGFVFALNALDLVFTVDALASGAVEANPVMARLLAEDLRLAALVKLSVGGGVVALIWKLRGYRQILAVALVVLAALFLLIAYHIVLRSML